MRALVVAIALWSTSARADEREGVRAEVTRHHLLYVEALGKAGPYGIGYEYAITARLGLGTAASYLRAGGDETWTASPYVHAWLGGPMFCELGAIFAHSHIASPVMGWGGASDSGGGGFATLGWQYVRGVFVVRASGGVAFGEGGLGPMLGIAVGAPP